MLLYVLFDKWFHLSFCTYDAAKIDYVFLQSIASTHELLLRSTASTHELLPRSNMVTNVVAEVGTALEMVQWQPFDFSGVGHFSVRRSLGEALLVGEKTGRDNAARLSTSARPELKWTPLTMQ